MKTYYGWLVPITVSVLILMGFSYERGKHASDRWWQKHTCPTNEVFVIPTGNDNNDCLSFKTACQTIGQALKKLDSSGVVYFKNGVYTSKTKDGVWLKKSRDETLADVEKCSAAGDAKIKQHN